MRSFSVSQANPFTFTGEQTDATTGLEYLRARYYDPATGALISRDPVPGINRFAYAEGDPINFTDPSGMCSHGKKIAYEGKSAAYQRAYDEVTARLDAISCGIEKAVWDAAKHCVQSTTCTMMVLAALGAAGGFEDLAGLGGEEAFAGEEGFAAGEAAAGGEEAYSEARAQQLARQLGADAGPGWKPGAGWAWKGTGPEGSSAGNSTNPKTKEWLHPDWSHPNPPGPHVDLGKRGTRDGWRLFPGGTVEPK